MARGNTLKILRTTRANLNTQAAANNLLVGEPYFITDEDKIAIGTAVNAYRVFQKESKVSVKVGSATLVVADRDDFIRFTGGGTCGLQAAATLGDGWSVKIRAEGTAVTIDPNGAETVNGATTFVIPIGGEVDLFCDGTQFFVTDAVSGYGTWTPTVIGLTTAGVGTYTRQIGRWWRTGKRISVKVAIDWTAHTGTGAMAVKAPFTAAGTEEPLTILGENITYSGQLACRINGNTDNFLIASNTSGSGVGLNVVDSVGGFQISGQYELP